MRHPVLPQQQRAVGTPQLKLPLEQRPLAHVVLLSLTDELGEMRQVATLKLDLGASPSKSQDARIHLC